MKRVKEIDIKNCTYFFDHMINIKNLDPNKIKLDKKPYKKKKNYLPHWIQDSQRP